MIKDYENIISFLKKGEKKQEEEIGVNLAPSQSNVISGDKLRNIQITTLNRLRDYLANTFGPMGSNTKIVKGENVATINSEYSKDGLKVLKNIIFSDPVEASITEELIEITRHVEKEVGDGTTSAVIISSYIFERFNKLMNIYNLPPYRMIDLFNQAVEMMQEEIMKRAHQCKPSDMYDIAMISTNGNTEVSENIKNIYKEYGMDVDLSIGISNTEDSLVKIYDGLVVDEGYSDPAYVNKREDNTCHIRNAHVYYFQDPVDTYDMIALFEKIINHNIIEPIANDDDEEVIPTVICTPRISKDTETILKNLATSLYRYDSVGQTSSKPPILVITNLVASDEAIMKDIADLCGCKPIKKFIDRQRLHDEQEAGTAPTLENVHEFFGIAEEVVSDNRKSKFINPQHMIVEENGEVKTSGIYDALVEFLETEIKTKEAESNAEYKGLLRRRLAALKANIVEYLVGGITIADREQVKDLVEDAIKNCKSAAQNGWGLAANFEGLLASYTLMNKKELDPILTNIFGLIFSAYYDASIDLYKTVTSKPDLFVKRSLYQKCPYNIKGGYIGEDPDAIEFNVSVKCTIRLDIEILNTIAKIISLMVTCNQCLLQAAHLNKY